MRAYQLQQADAATQIADLAADTKLSLMQLLSPTQPLLTESKAAKPTTAEQTMRPAFKTPAKRSKTLRRVDSVATELRSGKLTLLSYPL